jgi:high affinity Mn2+ porin
MPVAALACAALLGWGPVVLLAAQGRSLAADSTIANPSRWWLSAQVNVIYQWHPAFRALYTGANSLLPVAEHATSRAATVYSGLLVGRRTELLLDLEAIGGAGISQALGLAGFTNLDVVRNPGLGAAPYLARALVRYTIPLSGETESVTRGPLALVVAPPVRRVSLAIGKFSLADFLDLNSAGSDSHLQFLNWTVDNNGAYDYAADTRGYTIGALTEFWDRDWGIRFAEGMMPRVANGIDYDWRLAVAHSENLEVELRRGFLPRHSGAVRVLLYRNHADMGSYREAIDAFLSGTDPIPDITAHRRPGRTKAGAGVNVEQAIGRGVQVFGRAGVNDGGKESFAYTEVDQSVEVGAAWGAPPWRRDDRLGVAVVSNGLAEDHRQYLALGGRGFLLGDGALDYGREQIVEAFYTWSVGLGFSIAFDAQHVAHPGYNRARGPVNVFALRAHFEFPGSP